MTYAVVAIVVWVFVFPAAFLTFHAWASLMEWWADKPERRDA